MKNIILPTDFSENARRAMKYAIHLFDVEGVNFYIVNTYEPPHPTGMLIKIDDIVRNDSLAGLKNEENIIKRDFPDMVGSCKTICHLGELNDSLNVISKAKEGDLIVMGTKGATGLKEIFIGSNAAEVIQSSDFPVLAVPEKVSFNKPSTIVLATDYQNLKSLSVLDPLKHIAKKFDAEVIVVNVASDESGDIKFNPVFEKLALDEYFQGITHSYKEIKNDDVVDGLNEFLSEQKADILTMIPEKTNFLGRVFHRSVTKRMVLNTQIPLLALRE